MAPLDVPYRMACGHGSTATEAFDHRAGGGPRQSCGGITASGAPTAPTKHSSR
jgi:hypothetical protein